MSDDKPIHSCANCPSRRTTEWQVLSDSELELVDQAKRMRPLEPGAILFHQGDDAEGVYCIQSGLVGIRRLNVRGDSALIRLSSSGTTLGYRALLSKSPHRNSAEVLTPSVVCTIERSRVTRLLGENPRLGERFLQHCFTDMDETETDYAHSLTLHKKARFLHLLLVLYERVGHRDGTNNFVIDLPISRIELASLIGVQPASLSRLIRDIQAEGLLHFNSRRVRFTNMDAVLHAAGLEH